MKKPDLDAWTNDELKAEIVRLRLEIGVAATKTERETKVRDDRDTLHRRELATSRSETVSARQDVADAKAVADEAAGRHAREIADAAQTLASSQDLVAELQASRPSGCS